MVKIWGGLTEDPRKYPGGMFRSHPSGSKPKKTYIKCPKPFDIQRMIIAKNLMRLHDINVYLAKKTDLDFEKKVEQFRRLGLSGSRTPRTAFNKCRRKRIEMEGPPPRRFITETPNIHNTIERAYLGHGKYDFDLLTYKGIIHPRHLSMSGDIYNDKREIAFQRKTWGKRLLRDLDSEVVVEISSSYRMVALDGESFFPQHYFTTYLDSARFALKERNWTVVALCLSAMVKNVGDRPSRSMGRQGAFTLHPLWTYGFLLVINHFKNDMVAVTQFARQMQKLFYFKFPLYIGTHVAVWLIQKGYFLEAIQLLEEPGFSIENDAHPDHKGFTRKRPSVYHSFENPRKDQAIFIYDLIRATQMYVTWKRKQCMMLDNQDPLSFYSVHEDEVRRAGEQALSTYESIYTLHKSLGSDVMIFLHPLIELLIEYRSMSRAYQLLQELWIENDGNWFFEKYFVDFVAKHENVFDFEDIHKKMKDKVADKFTCTVDKDVTMIGRRKISKLRRRRKKEFIGIEQSFHQIPNPEFLLSRPS